MLIIAIGRVILILKRDLISILFVIILIYFGKLYFFNVNNRNRICGNIAIIHAKDVNFSLHKKSNTNIHIKNNIVFNANHNGDILIIIKYNNVNNATIV